MKRGEKLKGSIKRVLTDLFDLIALDLLWLVCSVPVVTVGPATSALYSVMLKVARGEPAATFSEFFKAFKKNFRQALWLGLILLAGAAIIAGDFYYGFNAEGPQHKLFLIVSGIAAAVWLTYLSYVFALQARFENTLRGHIKNAFLLAFVKPGRTVLMWVICLSPVLLYLCLPYIAVAYLGWMFPLFSASVPAYFNAKILRGIFDTLQPENVRTPEEEDEKGPDNAPEEGAQKYY